MPIVFGRSRKKGARGDYALAVEGLGDLRRALKRVDAEADKAVRRELKEIGDAVRDRAARNVEHKTGRHNPGQKHLEHTLKTSVTRNAVTVFSNAPHAGVQDRGGRVGHGAIIHRARASGYMTKAVSQSKRDTEAALGDIGRRLEADFKKG